MAEKIKKLCNCAYVSEYNLNIDSHFISYKK